LNPDSHEDATNLLLRQAAKLSANGGAHFFCLAMGSLYLMDGKDNSKAAVPPGAGMHWYLF